MASQHRLHTLTGLTAATLLCLGASPVHAAGHYGDTALQVMSVTFHGPV